MWVERDRKKKISISGEGAEELVNRQVGDPGTRHLPKTKASSAQQRMPPPSHLSGETGESVNLREDPKTSPPGAS